MSYYIIDSNNKKFEIVKTDILSKSGGTAIIYNVQGTDDFVLKLYNSMLKGLFTLKPWEM